MGGLAQCLAEMSLAPTQPFDENEALKALSKAFGLAPEVTEQIAERLYVLPPDRRRDILSRIMKDTAANADGVVTWKGCQEFLALREEPVSVREFVESPRFLDMEGVVYPKIMPHLENINSGNYEEVVLTGGIGSGKTTIAITTTAYGVYQLSLYADPHAQFGLDPASEILFVFQSVNQDVARMEYKRFRERMEMSSYFSKEFPFDRKVEGQLIFPNRIIVKPLVGKEIGAIGQNVFGGLLDEVNFMQRVEKSKQDADGGEHDQASVLYNSLARRRESRFMRGGKLPGVLCLASSKRYPGQFTDMKEEEAEAELKETGKSRIYIYDKRVWEVKPEGDFLGDKFSIFVGDSSRNPRFLEKGDSIAKEDRHLVMQIPVEFKPQFTRDITKSLRDIAGVSTRALNPYFIETDPVISAFGRRKSLFDRESVTFPIQKLKILKNRLDGTEWLRWAHIDLGLTSDSAGLTIAHAQEFKESASGDIMPVIAVDAMLEVRPPPNGEISFAKLRYILITLRDAGLPIRWVSFDSFQSADSMQLLRARNFTVDKVSSDRDNRAYDYLKAAFADGRVLAPRHDKCVRELLSLERDEKKGRIDHPMTGSKDCADSLACATLGLTLHRQVWAQHGISPMRRLSTDMTSDGEDGRVVHSGKKTGDDMGALARRKAYRDGVLA